MVRGRCWRLGRAGQFPPLARMLLLGELRSRVPAPRCARCPMGQQTTRPDVLCCCVDNTNHSDRGTAAAAAAAVGCSRVVSNNRDAPSGSTQLTHQADTHHVPVLSAPANTTHSKTHLTSPRHQLQERPIRQVNAQHSHILFNTRHSQHQLPPRSNSSYAQAGDTVCVA